MNDIKSQAQFALDEVRGVVNKIEEKQLQNEQWVLDWLDEINKLSVAY